MTGRLDGQKRQQWEERFERYRASGLPVGRFCANERVSVNTFYSWSKRLGRRSTTARSAEREGALGESRDSEVRRRVSAAATNSPLVHFRLNAGVEISVPANCLDVICCLVDRIQPSRAEGSDAFHEIVVGTR